VFSSSFRVHYSLLVAHSLRWLLIADSLRNWFRPHCVILNHRLTSHTAPPDFYTVAYCLLSESTAVSRVMSQWEVLPRHRGGGRGGVLTGPITVVAAALVCYVIAGGRGGVLHRANTSQYILILSRHVHLGLTNGLLHIFYFSEIVYVFLISPVRTVILSP
jgi:hypothetical protein